MRLRLDTPREPFGRAIEFQTWYSAGADDFSQEHLETLEGIVSELKDAELRARITDLLWYRRKGGYQVARLAVQSYLEAARILEHPRNWVQCAERIERAVQLAVSLGRSNVLFTEAISSVENILDTYQGEDPLFLSARMMEILLEHRQGQPTKYASLAEKAATRAENSEEGMKWHIANTYWLIKSQWHEMDGDAESSRQAKITAAETHVKEAEDALKRPGAGYSVAAHFLQEAIEALRRIDNTHAQREEIYKLMLEYQRNSVAELSGFSDSIDVSDIADKAIEMVKGKSFLEALMSLAFSSSSPKVDRLRKRVEEQMKISPLSHIFPANLLDREGKVIGRRSSIDPQMEDSDEAIRDEMFRLAAFDQAFHAQAVVQNAMHQINIDHNVRVNDFLPIVSNNPFVPPGRELIFARGLYSGLTGDLLLAAHLLIPQVEQSLRYALSQRGSIVSGLDSQQIQEEYTLNSMIFRYKSEISQIFDEDILFDLQGLLVERFGSNLRNLLAHGLMDHNEFYSWHILYLWWLVLRLCYIPIYIQIHKQTNSSEAEVDSNPEDSKSS